MNANRAAGFRIVGLLLPKVIPPRPAEPISEVIGWRYTGNKLHPN